MILPLQASPHFAATAGRAGFLRCDIFLSFTFFTFHFLLLYYASHDTCPLLGFGFSFYDISFLAVTYLLIYAYLYAVLLLLTYGPMILF